MTYAGFTRRQLIGTGVATIGAVAFVPTAAAADAPKMTTYMLDPTAVTANCKSCVACSACQHHAANRLFNSKKAADTGRAHAYCRCGIIEGQPLSPAVFKQVFADTDSADRRWKSMGNLLVAQVEQHSVPLFSGAAPIAALAVGAAGILAITARRDRMHMPET